MKIFVAGLVHETNSFSPIPTSVQSYADDILIRRTQPDALAQVESQAVLAGVLAAARRKGDTLLPGLFAETQPSGPLSRPAYEHLRDELLADLRAHLASGPVDAVVLVLHGAMLAEGYHDCEGDLLQRVRAIVGPAVPVGALLDLHCNLSPAMIDSGALLIACKEYPHIDYPARGEELHGLLGRLARGEVTLQAHWQRVPMVGIFGTTESPMREFVGKLQASETLPGVLSISALHGFAWSDTPFTSAAILVYTEDKPAERAGALALLDELRRDFHALRGKAGGRRLPLAEALDEVESVLARAGGPVVLADGSDNPGGGAACDSTFVLRALLERGLTEGVALGMFWDPQAVALATAAGVGARLPLRIGGKVGPMSGAPVDLDVQVLACRDDACQRGLRLGDLDPLGAAVAVRSKEGLTLVLNSIRQQVFSPDCFSELGVDLAAQRLVVVKSTQHFRAGFDPIAAATVYADAPGALQGDLSHLPYRHLVRPIWPLD